MFAHKYFEISRQTPFKLANKQVPRRMIICDKITNWVFLSLNCIPPVVTGVAAIGIESLEYKHWVLDQAVVFDLPVTDKMAHLVFLYTKMANISYYLTLSLPMISGLFLFCALCKIYNSMKKQQNETQVNIKAMTLHATSFAIYMVSVVLVLVSLVREYKSTAYYY